MNLPSFILKNALRNKRRALLSVLSVAMSLFLLVTLQVALRELTNPINDEGSSLRIIVRNKVSLAQPLPARQLQTLDRIPGIVAVTPFSFYGGLYKGDEKFTSFAQFAIDPQRALPLISDAKGVTKEQLDAWSADRTSCILGKMTADRYGLKVGDRMQFTGQIYPCDLELKIAGIYYGTADDRNLMFHQKYLDELLGNPGTVGTWWLLAASIAEAPLVTDRINKTFANTSAEVRAESERAFVLGFVSMWAILKAIGFKRRELFVLILAESFGLAMFGALIGAGGAWVLFNNINIQKMTSGMFLMFEVTPQMLGLAFAVAALLGLLSAVLPMINVARISVVQGLKTLD